MTITEIYDRFRINRGLCEHMLRVASVAKMICDSSTGIFNTKNSIDAALVHDMGNIVKFDFKCAPEYFEPEGIDYLKQVQQEVLKKYGTTAHKVTVAMLKEIEMRGEIMDIIDATGLNNASVIASWGSNEEKLMMYSDSRVRISGIVSLTERLDDLWVRYPQKYTKKDIEEAKVIMKKIEDEIFAHTTIAPEDITDESTKEIQKKLLDWTIAVLP